MEFFNKKEDVIDLELTPMGEILLSQGGFTPAYYAFFDDEILYDNLYGSLTAEEQKDTKNRIKDVPRMKPQVVFRTMDKPGKYTSTTYAVFHEGYATVIGCLDDGAVEPKGYSKFPKGSLGEDKQGNPIPSQDACFIIDQSKVESASGRKYLQGGKTAAGGKLLQQQY